MRIDHGYQGVPISGRKVGKSAQRPLSAAHTPADQSSEPTVSSEAASLLGNLHEIPEVRAEVLDEVRDRLNHGQYLTREAAEKTAEAILADLASFIGQ